MTQDLKTPQTRTIERTIEINAPIEAVWKALTDAEELKRWFPFDAKVKHGPGGSIWISWGPPYEGENWIEIWSPPNHLRVKDEWTEHAEIEKGRSERSKIAIDYFLETKGGKTVLRLVHSGFGSNSDWDDEYDAVSTGWIMELIALKHYLENHAGKDRRVVWAVAKIPISREEAWKRLMTPSGLLGASSNFYPEKNGNYKLVPSKGEAIEGKVGASGLFHFSGTVDNLNNGLFRIWVEKWTSPEPKVHVNLWLSGYEIPIAKILAFQTNWTKLLMKLFPEQLD